MGIGDGEEEVGLGDALDGAAVGEDLLGGLGVGLDESAGAELDAAEVARGGEEDVGDAAALEDFERGSSGGSGGFAVVGAAAGSAGGSGDEGVDDVGGVGVALLLESGPFARLVGGGDGKGLGDET